MLKRQPNILEKPGLVVAREDWHEGVIGIVAARLAERFHKPAAVISIRDGIGKGSARSIPGVNLHRVLQGCSQPLEGFGGHAMAAGLSIRKENLPDFQILFDQHVKAALITAQSQSDINIDARLRFMDISPRLIDEIEYMRPFGQENAEPLLMTEKINVVRSQTVGGRHLKLWLQQSGHERGQTFEAIRFNVDPAQPAPLKIDAMVYRLHWNYWNGKKAIQLKIEDMQ
jgi:single-stranded-DNA-specific exonuclease